MKNVLCQIQLGSSLLFPSELHHEVLIPRLALLDWNTQAHLKRSQQVRKHTARRKRPTMNNTCKSSLGNKNSFNIVE